MDTKPLNIQPQIEQVIGAQVVLIINLKASLVLAQQEIAALKLPAEKLPAADGSGNVPRQG